MAEHWGLILVGAVVVLALVLWVRSGYYPCPRCEHPVYLMKLGLAWPRPGSLYSGYCIHCRTSFTVERPDA